LPRFHLAAFPLPAARRRCYEAFPLKAAIILPFSVELQTARVSSMAEDEQRETKAGALGSRGPRSQKSAACHRPQPLYTDRRYG
jgi:hypothetical protein